jgi:hypothetical protein
MPGLVPGIHVLELLENKKNVDGGVKPGHDDHLGPNFPGPISWH